MKALRPSERAVDRRALANALRMPRGRRRRGRRNPAIPGMPMGMADIAEVLWNGYLKHNPADPRWAPTATRFVLSNGHGSMLLYALLHLTGYDLPLEELKRFRQLHSKTAWPPGAWPHAPASRPPPARSARALPNAVGMALAERLLADEFKPARPYRRRSSHVRVFSATAA